MNPRHFALAGLACGGVGLFLGLSLSSAVPSSPSVYGSVAAGYAVVVAAVTGGLRRHQGDPA